MEADFNNATLDGALDIAIFAALIGKRHVVPARVASFDKDTQTIIAEPMISVEDHDGNPVAISPVVDVPILQLGGGNYVITFNPSAGDGCLLLVSDRCIDDWYETGEKRVPGDFRQNDISDSLAIVGFRTKPAALKDILDGYSIRSVDGSHYVNVNNGVITNKATKVVLDTAEVDASKATVTMKEAVINGIKFTTHKHGGVESGGSSTDVPK